MNKGKKVLFIINKFSGAGMQQSLEGAIVRSCGKREVECHIEFTRARGHATDLARIAAASEEFTNVIAVGGDGTVNEVAQGLVHSPVTMGILPKGSGNGLARHLGIPLNIGKALNALLDGKAIAMDTFLMNDKLSLNVSGIGFDGHVANLFGKNKKRGLKSYANISLREYTAFTEFEANVSSGNREFQRHAFIIAIANASQYGNNARIAPAASVCDGKLHVCFLKKIPAYRLDFLFSMFSGKIEGQSFCEIVETDHMQIRANRKVPFHIDGEPCGETDVCDIRIQPRSLNMMVPEGSLRL